MDEALLAVRSSSEPRARRPATPIRTSLVQGVVMNFSRS
jgi:hypothetical protein